ncbi:hypothetical protein [Glaciibacter superstes]|uniref:hypothetical protein n=1 Tax=Glaciibacter superstes TaxID=501023 RepID=UPI0003B7553E|nr:hypothetical protein [Glaciibacter superstes]
MIEQPIEPVDLTLMRIESATLDELLNAIRGTVVTIPDQPVAISDLVHVLVRTV